VEKQRVVPECAGVENAVGSIRQAVRGRQAGEDAGSTGVRPNTLERRRQQKHKQEAAEGGEAACST
jgi:hypothetical protein